MQAEMKQRPFIHIVTIVYQNLKSGRATLIFFLTFVHSVCHRKFMNAFCQHRMTLIIVI